MPDQRLLIFREVATYYHDVLTGRFMPGVGRTPLLWKIVSNMIRTIHKFLNV